MNVKQYIRQVDSDLEEFRKYLLGQKIPFREFLPCGGVGMSKEEQFRWLADRTSFYLIARTPGISQQEARRTWEWMYGLIRYLHRRCRESEHHFGSVARLIGVSANVRKYVFEGSDPYLAPLREEAPPESFKALEEAVVELAGEGRLPKWSAKIGRAHV